MQTNSIVDFISIFCFLSILNGLLESRFISFIQTSIPVDSINLIDLIDQSNSISITESLARKKHTIKNITLVKKSIEIQPSINYGEILKICVSNTIPLQWLVSIVMELILISNLIMVLPLFSQGHHQIDVLGSRLRQVSPDNVSISNEQIIHDIRFDFEMRFEHRFNNSSNSFGHSLSDRQLPMRGMDIDHNTVIPIDFKSFKAINGEGPFFLYLIFYFLSAWSIVWGIERIKFFLFNSTLEKVQ